MYFRYAAVCAALGGSFVWSAPMLSIQQSESPPAAQSAPPPTFVVHAQLVNLPVIVRDRNGVLVTTLNKDDFNLAIDGRTQPIRYFDRDNNLPLSIGLLVDISGSVRSALDEERTASDTFLDQMVTSQAKQQADQAFLIQFAHEVDLLQDLTTSVPKLRRALHKVGDEYRDASQDRDNSGYGGSGHRRGFREVRRCMTLFISVRPR